MRRWSKIAVLLALAAELAPTQQPAPGQGRIVSLTGTMAVRRGGQTLALHANQTVQAGDELITGDRSEAAIQTPDGSTVRIFPDSRVIFSGLPSSIGEYLKLLLGSVKVHVEKLGGRPNPHKMTTPTAIIAVRGTTFSVFVDEDDATLVAVDEGLVSVANIRSPAGEVLLRQGQRTWVRQNRPPAQAQRFRGASEKADLEPSRGGQRATEVASANASFNRSKDNSRGKGGPHAQTAQPGGNVTNVNPAGHVPAGLNKAPGKK